MLHRSTYSSIICSGVMRGLVLMSGNGSIFPVGSTTSTHRMGIGVLPSPPHMQVLETYRTRCFIPLYPMISTSFQGRFCKESICLKFTNLAPFDGRRPLL